MEKYNVYKYFKYFFIKKILKQFIIFKILSIRTILFILLQFIICNDINSQSKISDFTNKKITDIKKKLRDDSLRITGALKIYAGYRIFSQNKTKPFEYRISANLNLSYRGISIPLAYNFSNGRSLYRLAGPNVNLPQFNNLGFSPTYKWAKLHIGTRTMSFSRYTYDNLRFVGGGMELTPDHFHLKFFNGKIFQSNLNDIQFANSLTQSYNRKAWGLMSGYKSKTAEYSAIIFKSFDDFESVLDTSILRRVTPKANTAIGLVLKQTIFDKLTLSYDWALSALTYNARSPRVEIPTHWTMYNMLGLYEKNSSSKYTQAKKIDLSYNLEDHTYTLSYERVDKDYRSLGSLIFDNNYEAYTIGTSHNFFKKINTNVEIGIRKDGISPESVFTGHRWIGNISANYMVNDRLSFNTNYSNFRNVERNYFQTLNSVNSDSLSISLLNQNFNLSSTYALDKNKKSLLTLMYSNQTSNRIQSDSLINNSKLTNHLYSVNYTFTQEKYNFSSAISYMQNKTDAFFTKAYITNLAFSYNLSDKMITKSNLTFNLMKANISPITSLSFNQDLNYQITKKQQLTMTNRWNFSTSQDKFRLLENLIELDYSLKF